MSDYLRLRRVLGAAPIAPTWPPGVTVQPSATLAPQAIHGVLASAYANTAFGSVPPFPEWWPALTADSEFDPALLLVACEDDRRPIGVCQCWTGGFIKDFGVLPVWRGKGVGAALLQTCFAAFFARQIHAVDLKVVRDNIAALRLYRSVGMAEVP